MGVDVTTDASRRWGQGTAATTLGVGLTVGADLSFTLGNKNMAEFPDIVEASLRARFVSLGVRPEDMDERFVRGTGAGGQKINKTSSTVWLQHRPTGLLVRCQRERSQSVNRLLAWTELAEKLEWRRQMSANRAQAARELIRRQKRQKSRGQKVRMIEGKKHRARIKSKRGRRFED